MYFSLTEAVFLDPKTMKQAGISKLEFRSFQYLQLD
jgi:hypothetical protein